MIFDNGPSLSRYKKCDWILIAINCYVVVVAQLVERSLQIYFEHFENTKIKKKEAKNGPFLEPLTV